MAQFTLKIVIDDAKAQELYGQPLDADGLITAIEAALGNLGAEVSDVHDTSDTPDDGAPVV